MPKQLGLLKIPVIAGDPASPSDGDVWYNSSTTKFRRRENGSSLNWADQSGVRTINFVVDGGGSVITTGSKGYVIFDNAGTISQWTLLGDQSGSCIVDIKRSTYAGFPTTTSLIGGGTAPTLSSAQKQQASPVSWTSVTLAAGDVLEFSITSASTLTRLVISLKVTLT